jgi:hypothetical protein
MIIKASGDNQRGKKGYIKWNFLNQKKQEARTKNKVQMFYKITKSTKAGFNQELACVRIKIMILLDRIR